MKRSLTLKQWADFPPAGDASFTGKLTHRRLQEKDGDAAAHKEDDVRDEEGTFTTQGVNTQNNHQCFMQHSVPTQLGCSASSRVSSVATSDVEFPRLYPKVDGVVLLVPVMV